MALCLAQRLLRACQFVLDGTYLGFDALDDPQVALTEMDRQALTTNIYKQMGAGSPLKALYETVTTKSNPL